MKAPAPFWFAEMSTEHTRSWAFGATPQEALAALVALWVEKHCANWGACKSLPWSRKDDIELGRAEPGQAYMMAGDDRLYFPASMNGAAEALSGTWADLAQRYGIAPDARLPTREEAFAQAIRDAADRDGVEAAIRRMETFLVEQARQPGQATLLERATKAMQSRQ